jgi:outer membrane protein assembly factor BamB
VFGGSNEGNFYALDAQTGQALCDFQTGSSLGSNPISLVADGQQYVAVAAGKAVFGFGLALAIV